MTADQQALFTQAVEAHQAARFDEAEALYRRVVAADPDHKLAHNNIGILLARAGLLDQAVESFQSALRIDPTYADALGNLGMALRENGRIDASIDFLNMALGQAPRSIYVGKQLITSLIKAGHAEEARPIAEALFGALPDDEDVLRSMLHILISAGEQEAGVSVGQRLIEARDQRLMSDAPMDLPTLQAQSNPAGVNVISFSLYGDGEEYAVGALENARLAKLLYPGWEMRVYHDHSVPQAVLDGLTTEGVCLMPVVAGDDAHGGLFWRFRVADDPSVNRFIIRDCDSRLNTQEAAAVADWIADGRPFHAMHDHPLHVDMILAGMWGGMAGMVPGGLMALVERTVGRHPRSCDDQTFLATAVWPMIRDQLVNHSTYYQWAGSRPFPEQGRLERPDHVGSGIRLAADAED